MTRAYCDRCGGEFPLHHLQERGAFLTCKDESLCRPQGAASATVGKMTGEDLARLEDKLAHDDGLSPHHWQDFQLLFAELRRLWTSKY